MTIWKNFISLVEKLGCIRDCDVRIESSESRVERFEALATWVPHKMATWFSLAIYVGFQLMFTVRRYGRPLFGTFVAWATAVVTQVDTRPKLNRTAFSHLQEITELSTHYISLECDSTLQCLLNWKYISYALHMQQTRLHHSGKDVLNVSDGKDRKVEGNGGETAKKKFSRVT